jgi:hypothetical protein
MKYPNYEFNDAQNAIISALAGRTMIMGGVMVAIGVPFLALLIKGDLMAAGIGVLYIIIGLLSLNSSAAFKRIVTTSKNDIGYLMEALQALTTMYTIQLVAIVLVAVGFAILEFKLFQ